MEDEIAGGFRRWRLAFADQILTVRKAQNGFIVKYMGTTWVYGEWKDVVMFVAALNAPELEKPNKVEQVD